MDGSQPLGSLVLSEGLLGAAAQAEGDDSGIRRAREAFLREGLVDALVVGLAAAALLTFLIPLRPEVVFVGYALAVLPFSLAVLMLGLGRVAVPFPTLALFSVTATLGAYALVLIGRFTPGGGPSVWWTSALFAVAFASQYAALTAGLLQRDHKQGIPHLPSGTIGLNSVATIALLTLIAFCGNIAPPVAIEPALVAALYAAALFPPIVANWAQARREKKLPVKASDKQPDHISGLGAITLILFVVVIVTLGLWAAATGVNAQISKFAGIIVLMGLVVAFSIVAFGLPSNRRVSKLHRFVKTIVKPVGWLFSIADSLLVYAVANALGTNDRSPWLRYGLLLGSLLPCAALGWWLTPPFGLIPLTLALIGAIAIARRWAWVEEDRENAMLARRFDGDHIRVGFSQDLRDEALIGFMVLFLVVPIALRQLHLSFEGGLFTIENARDVNDLRAWMSFFGTELAKAVPFVDWAEIYQVEGDVSIRLDDSMIGPGQHVVFGTRVLVDLVLLAAFLQAIAITQRTRKLKDMFYVEESLNRLDPFIEPNELRKLARSNGDGFEILQETFDKFPVYDPDRLEELKQRGERDDIGFIATRLLERDEGGGPEELLSREARREKPDIDRCIDFLAQVRDQPEVQVGSLKAAHYALNRHSSFLPIRVGIAEQIARALPERAAINALSEILIGPAPGVQDPRREARVIALNALFREAVNGNKVAQASIRHAAAHDPAQALRNGAREMLEYSSNW